MNPKPLLTILAGIMLLISCGKEESFEKRKAEEKELLLTKITRQQAGTSYVVTEAFSYDNKNRLINLKNDVEGTGNEPYAEQEFIWQRNEKGMVKTFTEIWTIYDENNNLTQKDSVALNLIFSAEGKYIYGIRMVPDTDEKIRDSVTYSYNNKGRINQVRIFRKKGDNGEYEDFQNSSFTYDEKENITTMSIQFAENVQDPVQILNFQYNDKVSPLSLKDEAVLNGLLAGEYSSPHCLTSVRDISEPENNMDIRYDEYNQAGKPVKATSNNISTQERNNISYFYQ